MLDQISKQDAIFRQQREITITRYTLPKTNVAPENGQGK